MTNPFDKLFNVSAPSNLFGTDENAGSGGLFDNKEEPAKKEEAAPNTDLFGQPIEEEVEPAKAEPVKAQPVKAEPVKAEPKKEEPKKAEPAKPAKAAPKKKANKDIRVGPAWNIAYAAQQNNPPEVDMTLEQVRQWMELDYPELSLERTTWDVDEDKQLIVPIVKGAKMG